MHGQHLTFKPSPMVEERLRTLGRTEDVVFSPDQVRLAIAGFNENKVLILGIKIAGENGVMSVLSEECVELRCREFQRPHGLCWIDDHTLVIANRRKDVIVVSVPDVSDRGNVVEVEPLLRLSEGGEDIVGSPGSVAVSRLGDQHLEFLVCNNYRNYISRHIIHRGNGFEVIAGHRFFEHGLKVPDGIAVTTDGKLVAVSNHDGRRVDLFRNDGGSTTHSPPVLSLGVPHYPHGVRFAMDDRILLVADAGAPFVHVYARSGDAWNAAPGPVESIRVMDDDSFRRGQKTPKEGGPKGLDILADGSLVVISCEEVPIAFLDFRSVRDRLAGPDEMGRRDVPSGEARMLEVFLATMKGQQAQIEAMGAEIKRLKATRDRRLDRRIIRFLKRAAANATASAGKSREE